MMFSLATIQVKEMELLDSNTMGERIQELRGKLITNVVMDNSTGNILAVDRRFAHLVEDTEYSEILLIPAEYNLIMSKPLE